MGVNENRDYSIDAADGWSKTMKGRTTRRLWRAKPPKRKHDDRQ